MRKLAWYAFCGLIAAVAIFAHLDMQTRRSPELAALVPQPFRAHAQERLTQAAVRTRSEGAGELARGLVRKRPMPAESLSLFAVGASLEGNDEIAAEAFRVAALRGWREPAAQYTMALAAIQAGEWRIAADRTVALLKVDEPGVAQQLIERLVAEESGRMALVQSIAAFGNRNTWRTVYRASEAELSAGELEAFERLAEQSGVRVR